jgi:hypothetical protein
MTREEALQIQQDLLKMKMEKASILENARARATWVTLEVPGKDEVLRPLVIDFLKKNPNVGFLTHEIADKLNTKTRTAYLLLQRMAKQGHIARVKTSASGLRPGKNLWKFIP